MPFSKQQQRKIFLKKPNSGSAMQHSHLDFNYPFIFFCVTVLFVMGNFTRLVPELALRGFACHPGPDVARLSLC